MSLRSLAVYAMSCVFMLPLFSTAGFAAGPIKGWVDQSEREVPIIDEVDVLVIGGSTGACAAAIEAANRGADVMLVSPFPYLGDDMTATLRMWLEPGEVPSDPLAVAIFNDSQLQEASIQRTRLSFTYEADRESDAVHRDTNTPSKLCDGKASSASTESVQYCGDVTITCDLGRPQPVADVQIMAFYRGTSSEPGNNFKVGRVTVSTSMDGETWEKKGTVQPSGLFVPDDGVSRFNLDLTDDSDASEARYVRLKVEMADDVERMLLAEILILPPIDTGDDIDDSEPVIPAPRPMHVKRVLDNALLEAGVKFLYSSHVTDLLRTDKTAQYEPGLVIEGGGNELAGVVIANRSGRQAIRAKVIIDATDRAYVARMADAAFRPWPAGPQELEYVVIGGEPKPDGVPFEEKGIPYEGKWPNAIGTASGVFPVYNYKVKVDMPDAGWATWSKIENDVRMATFHDEQQFAADRLFQVPPDSMGGMVTVDKAGISIDKLPIGAFLLPVLAEDNLIVLGGCADIPRETAARLMRPLALIEMGRRLGAFAFVLVSMEEFSSKKNTASPVGVEASLTKGRPVVQGDVGEVLVGVRPTQELPTLVDPARDLSVLGKYDVVVVGGGTSGAPAGISAARAGAKTLVIEYLHTLGGVGTTGAISNYYWGNKVGFTATVPGSQRWVIEQKMQWWRSELSKAGGELWCGTLGIGAFYETDPSGDRNRVRGVVVSTPEGRGVVLADVVIDCTGSSDIAYAAGAECMYTDEKELAVQGTGLPPRELGASYTNTDFTLVDETDTVDVWHVFVYAKDKYATAFEQGKLIDTRERRRIVGDYLMTLLDQINHRTYPDTVMVAYSNFDTHGYTVDPYCELEHPEKVGHYVNTPYRCMIPKELDGILVGGLGLSCTRDAIPLVRMQPDLQNQGYALGRAAAMASRDGVSVREIDLKTLQQHLIEIGNLPESVLTDTGENSVTDEQLAEAIRTIPDEFKGVSVVMWVDRQRAKTAVRRAFIESLDDGDRPAIAAYAQVLAVMGDPIGVDVLIDQVEAIDAWDAGWNYKGMGQFGSALSPLDRLIVALGRAGETKAVPAILDKLSILKADDDFSHHRACALSLEMLDDPAAVPVLVDHLTKDGMTGFVNDTLEKARQADAASPEGTNAVQTRRDSLRELVTARALYRCGDYNKVGQRTLEAYIGDLRGHFSRHAKAVLEEGAGSGGE